MEFIPVFGIILKINCLRYSQLCVVRISSNGACSQSYFMKTNILKKIFITGLPALISCYTINAQVADWNFNNVLTGTGSANATAGVASLGSSIDSAAFNGGTVYYGQDGWPTGAMDMNAYLEFSITPTSGHTLTLASLTMQIRRSTTGSANAGPNNWTLRSNLDGYTSNIASGVLTPNSTPATTFILGVAFMNVPTKIVFRLYGYNATVSTGGLNRFVYDDIQVSGSTTLPFIFDYFNVKATNKTALISWQLGGEGDLSSLKIERSSDGVNFESIKEYSGDEVSDTAPFEYADQLTNPSGVYEYRIEMISNDGNSSFSGIQSVSFDNQTGFQLQGINTGSSSVSFRVNTEKSGNYVFSLLNLNGNKVAVKSSQLDAGTQVMQMNNMPLPAGIYILLGENGNQTISTKIMVL
jgi:hypothetical protein